MFTGIQLPFSISNTRALFSTNADRILYSCAAISTGLIIIYRIDVTVFSSSNIFDDDQSLGLYQRPSDTVVNPKVPQIAACGSLASTAIDSDDDAFFEPIASWFDGSNR